MKITLRKRDSVISAVLFVFNLYGEARNSHSIRLGSLLRMMQQFDKSEASIRTGLSRMTKSGILTSRKESGDTIYELTQEGMENLDQWNRGLARFFFRHAQRQKAWDGAWHLLSILGFNKSDYDNQDVVDELNECGLRELNGNIWATPYPIDETALALLNMRGFRYLEIHGSIQPSKDPGGLIEDAFNLSDVRQLYSAFFIKADEVSNSLSTLHGGAFLPVLFELGWDFYDAATSDPALPKALLPEWEGDKAAEKMKTIRPLLVREITGYFEENDL